MVSSSLTFYTHPQSRGRIVRWMLEEVGEPYDTVLLDYGSAMKAPSYRAVNPMGKVPAIRHGDTVVTETAAICAYLADAFPAAGLAPAPRTRERGPYYRWLFFAAGPLEAAAINRAVGVVVPPGYESKMGYGTYGETLDALEGAVVMANPWLLGAVFTAADVYVGSHLMFGTRFGTIPRRAAFDAYMAGLEARPAYGRAVALDDAALPAPRK